MAEWSPTDLGSGRDPTSYRVRINHLRNVVSGGLNSSYFLDSTTLTTDSVVDQLYGEADLDWFLVRTLDQVNDSEKIRGIDETSTAVNECFREQEVDRGTKKPSNPSTLPPFLRISRRSPGPLTRVGHIDRHMRAVCALATGCTKGVAVMCICCRPAHSFRTH